MESGNREEVGSRALPQQDQELAVVYLAVPVQIGLVDHLLDIQ
jgi:hypothetical protein